jgi:alkylation response protein AidB-like acyl-CoA dehydrogenase
MNRDELHDAYKNAAGFAYVPPEETQPLDATPTGYTLVFMALIFMCMGAAAVVGWHLIGMIGR